MVTRQGREPSDGPGAGPGRWSGRMALLWAAGFFYLGVAPLSVGPFPGLDGADVVGHVLASGLLALLVAEWLVAGRGLNQPTGVWGGLAIAVAFGVIIEVVQESSAVRTLEAVDVVADLVGATAGATTHHLATRWVTPRRRLTEILNLVAPVAVLGVAVLVVGS